VDTDDSPSPLVNAAAVRQRATAGDVLADNTVPAAVPVDLFRSERWDPPDTPDMQWDFPIAAGNTVEVRLYFCETFEGVTDRGQRVFDVRVEDQTVLDDLDQFAEAGPNVAFMRSVTVMVGDGNLDIDFHHVADNPAIKGIEVLGPLSAIPPAAPEPDDGPSLCGAGSLFGLFGLALGAAVAVFFRNRSMGPRVPRDPTLE
jgi:hypothetical protein